MKTTTLPTSAPTTPKATDGGDVVTSRSILYMGAYLCLWSAIPILIRATQDETHAFSPLASVFVTNILKLVIIIIAAGSQRGFDQLGAFFQEIYSYRRLGVRMYAPALLYSFYNWIMFAALQIVDPLVYKVVLNMRVFISAVLWQIVFQRKISARQWLAMAILIIGILVMEVTPSLNVTTSVPVLSMLVFACVCSSSAGVANEFLLKDTSGGDSMNVKNFYMYITSLSIDVVSILLLRPDHFLSLTLFDGFSPSVWFACFLLAVGGIATAFFLRYLSVLMKEFAHGLEMIMIALLQYLCFGVPLELRHLIAVVLVSVGVFLYNSKKE